MGKIAAEVERALAERAVAGAPGGTAAEWLAAGEGWSVSDVVCTAGPEDRAFEEEHGALSVAIVVAGTFQYRSTRGAQLMTPGAFLLGNPGECFECGHEHAAGDRCVAFRFTPEYVDRLVEALAIPGVSIGFRAARVPPLPESSSIVARTCAGLAIPEIAAWEELALEAAATAVALAAERRPRTAPPSREAVARVTASVRAIQQEPSTPTTLADLAADAGLSPFHYLRTFQRATGVTPHQFRLRMRLRDAATRLLSGRERVIDAALEVGFGDLSNFNHAFRAEFGLAPQAYRARYRR